MPPELLVVSDDAQLVDDVMRCAAAVGRRVDTVADLDECGPLWKTARLVLVGSDVLPTPMPQRDRVIMVTHDAGPTSPVWRTAHELHAQHVAALPDAESWLIEQLDELDAHHRARVLGVIGARGGSGATSMAVALACTAAESGRSVLLVDADPVGGGIELAMGCEGMAGTRWSDLAERSGRLPAATLVGSLPQRHGVHVLSFDRIGGPPVTQRAAASVFETARRAFDVVVVDLPRSASNVARVAQSVAEVLVLVTPRDVRAVAGASCVVSQLTAGHSPLLVTRGPAPGGLAVADVTSILDLTWVADIPFDKNLAAQLERGVAPGSSPRSPMARAAQAVLEAA